MHGVGATRLSIGSPHCGMPRIMETFVKTFGRG